MKMKMKTGPIQHLTSIIVAFILVAFTTPGVQANTSIHTFSLPENTPSSSAHQDISDPPHNHDDVFFHLLKIPSEQSSVTSAGLASAEAGRERTTIRPNEVCSLRLALDPARGAGGHHHDFVFSVDRPSGAEGAASGWVGRLTKRWTAAHGQRYSARLSWDAGQLVDVQLAMNPAFFNLTITPNFDKFRHPPSSTLPVFVDLLILIEPLFANLVPAHTLFPLFGSASLLLFSVCYFRLPAKLERFVQLRAQS